MVKSADLMNDFASFAMHTPTAVAMLDTNMVYIMASEKWKQDYSITDETIIGKSHYEIFPEVLNMPNWVENHRRALNGEVVIDKESLFIQKDGRRDWTSGVIKPWYNEAGEIGGVIMFTEIITAKKRLEIKLKTRNKELEKIKDLYDRTSRAARIGSWYFDVGTKHLEWNKMIYDIYELDPVEDLITVEKSMKYYHPGFLSVLNSTIYDAIVNNISFDKEVQIFTSTGKTVWVRAIGLPIRENNWCVGISGLLQDINESKINELRLKENIDKLQNFAYIVSHNLRTHTSNLSGLKTLYKASDDQNERDFLINQFDKVVDSLGSTVDGLGEIIDAQKIKSNTENIPIKFKDVFKKVQVNIGSPIPENNVCFQTSFDIQEVKYNFAYLESIFLNLITNSIKYRNPEKNPLIKIKTFKNAGFTFLQFQDNGLGIDLEKYGHKIFGIYNTFHSNTDKQGIGLYLIKNQIESMGGSISVESEPNVGTTFTIKF